MLDKYGRTSVPKTTKDYDSEPVIILDNNSSTATKRSLAEDVAHSSKKHCSKNKQRCATPNSKQTRIDHFIGIQYISPKNESSLPPQPSTSKDTRHQGPRALPSDKQPLLITDYFSRKNKSHPDKTGVEVVSEVFVKKPKGDGLSSHQSDDCFITKTERDPPVSLGRVKRSVDIEVLEEGRPRRKSDEECIITEVKRVSQPVIVLSEDSDWEKKCKVEGSGVTEHTVTSSGNSASGISKPAYKCVKVLHFPGIRIEKEPSKISDGSEADMRDLPEISEQQDELPNLSSIPKTTGTLRESIASGLSQTCVKNYVSTLSEFEHKGLRENLQIDDENVKKNTTSVKCKEQTYSQTLGSVMTQRDLEHKSLKENLQIDDENVKKNTTSVKSKEQTYSQTLGSVMTQRDLEKLPENMKKCVNSQATHIQYSKKDMKITVVKSIQFSKVINQLSMSVSNHAESKLLQQNEAHHTTSSLMAVLHPASTFQCTTAVRELSEREVAFYESSTDEDTMESKMAETEKGIIIMGIQGLHLFITPYMYPPPATLGHLLQKMVFEAPFALAYSRAIDIAHRVLFLFPPLNLKMRKYYVSVLSSAAKHDKEFHEKLYLPWKFMVRPIESLLSSPSSSNDSSMSSSCENDSLHRSSSLGLLEFIVTLLSEDLRQPNHKELVREHIAWQVFWGHSQDPREITPPIKQLLRFWISAKAAPVTVRYCLGTLVAIVMELAWRHERCLLLPVTPQPFSIGNLADFIRHRIQECGSNTLMQLMCELPTPWSRAVLGIIVFQSEAQVRERDLALGDIVEYALLLENQQEQSKSKVSDTAKVLSLSPRRKQQKSINKRGPKGETKLVLACMKDNVSKVHELLAVPGIDINLADNNGWTALHEAAIRGHDSCVKALLSYDCSKSVDMKNTLHLYLRRANYYVCNVFAQSYNGDTALHDAVSNNHFETAKLLLDHGGGALLKIANNDGKTALMLCTNDAMNHLLRSYEGKSSVKGSQKVGPRRSSLSSRLDSSHRFILGHADKKKFILIFTNNFMEASVVRFARFDMIRESYKMYCQSSSHQENQQQQRGSQKHRDKSSHSESSRIDGKLSCSYTDIQLTSAETELFEPIYDSIVSNMKTAREFNHAVLESSKQSSFISSLTNILS
ncbi:SMC5-SMC6 complex localization factor protein 1-like isoform X2 [Macrobrachium rosenbergii]